MTWDKRLFDLFFASLLIVILGPILLALLVWLLIKEGRPIFYVAERMKAPGEPFNLWKLRTMTVVDEDSGVSGGDKAARVTKTGAWLRSKRLDEFPQLWNILRGDLSFVGPRPPLRQYVEAYPEIYNEVLKSRPGVTGLASIVYHRHEAALLERCETREETNAIYSRICVPAKARLDLIYQRHQNMAYDFDLVFQTIGNIFMRR
ncbi:UDP-glucose:undecaprenyl-phosphate glucose-1-phosphate transferase [Tritonibacter multivorans]|uniref:UDP-glucose:undecaprenyl-phosphate glucose-1-phosphate transferase n=1 Tax=Tritonibacter multivorans TaxID=928856 RepID=A0A0P1GGR5_9RHOB|nr:sugar transferase [Tritonibacter multivorans]MDA7422719.1 sugar transferase [Tritonibacter multivorans]CUH80794.1 UDP-glucose:undecaprenyl-phosphate glucose-1-phosphate transferase [Tritonibacter multivorans]SFD55562.1 Sugar transferase involved in LPS biosynthesis (colanic, teichoic acid) [Tritonibacter multivorans]